MATGSGKTVVMAMLIAWQTLNKVQSPRDSRFTNRFLVVTPGITIKDRLRVLRPEDPENYADLRDLIPPDLKGGLKHARIVITNYHAFQRSLHRSYARAFIHWETSLQQYGETPPVFIVVCPNTVVSKLVYDWIAGVQVEQGGAVVAQGNLDLLSNVVDGRPLARPRTILMDSAQLESGEGIKADFKQAAGAEIAAFKAEYRRRNPGADIEKITDDELLREVMNTVG